MSHASHFALVGFANSGKSTFFNALTGAKQQTGNWTGVTVAMKQQPFSFNNQSVLLSDLPGVSSLASRAQQGKDLSITQNFLKNDHFLLKATDDHAMNSWYGCPLPKS